MCKYIFSCSNLASQFVEIQLEFGSEKEQKIDLQLPAWRAGRYQLANYSQYIRSFHILNQEGLQIPFAKSTKDCWTFSTEKNQNYRVVYEFFCARMDAGGAWIDDQHVYINLINCCFEIKGKENLPFQLHFNFPQFDSLLCTLPKNKEGLYIAENFQELADSTLVASNSIVNWEYSIENTIFQIWIQGSIHFEKENFIGQFKKFTETQIRDFGEFPEAEYHFIFQLLPYKHYHGVEHQKGTVITFGPAESLADSSQMEELIGVSSHELYHAWNVCRIRPTELLPYDFSKENYSKAGWMLEGITTYMGDLYLLKSGVYSLETFLEQIESTLKREIANEGWKNQSILESSFDLWLDGYQMGIPDRKVNIYTHGCIITFCLDILLLEQGGSFPKVMKSAWEKFGKPKVGYTDMGFWKLILDQAEDPSIFQDFYHRFISGKEDLLPFFAEKINLIGLALNLNPNQDPLAQHLGILTSENKIVKIHQYSPAFHDLMIGDEIKFQLKEKLIHVAASRINGAFFEFTYEIDKSFFPDPKLKIGEETELRVQWMK